MESERPGRGRAEQGLWERFPSPPGGAVASHTWLTQGVSTPLLTWGHGAKTRFSLCLVLQTCPHSNPHLSPESPGQWVFRHVLPPPQVQQYLTCRNQLGTGHW